MIRRTDLQIQVSSIERGSFGGGYFNPVSDFFCVARPLRSQTAMRLCDAKLLDVLIDGSDSYAVAKLFHEMQELLRSDESLFGAYDIGGYRVAVHIVDEERLIDFELRVANFEIERLAFYGLKRSDADIGLKNNCRSWV